MDLDQINFNDDNNLDDPDTIFHVRLLLDIVNLKNAKYLNKDK